MVGCLSGARLRGLRARNSDSVSSLEGFDRSEGEAEGEGEEAENTEEASREGKRRGSRRRRENSATNQPTNHLQPSPTVPSRSREKFGCVGRMTTPSTGSFSF
ncbi:hypothetical protein LY78DRAFT_663058 [Colletotrichum sublineola]|nr:hypothetical protein LY78DRAFT_663058 [Colletotrichum sublineola]